MRFLRVKSRRAGDGGFYHRFYHFAELSAKLKLAEESNNALSRQIQDYRSKDTENVRIIQEKQKLVSILFLPFFPCAPRM